MKTHKKIAVLISVVAALALIGTAIAGYIRYTPITNVTITSHNDYDPVYVGQEYTLTCTTSTDKDCDDEGEIVNDPVTHTWSGPGTFNPQTGTTVTWIPPDSNGNVTITVTASDNSSPAYANDTDKTDSVILTVQNTLYYVDVDANGNDDGTSWTDAYNDLQDALGAVTSGDEIWVAEGTYKPTAGASRTISFELVDGVGVYGGFDATETARSQRDWVNNETILSGDIDNDGELDGDNSYHVVYSTDCGEDTILDGFTVTLGYMDYVYFDLCFCAGGGMFNENYSCPVVKNCTFIKNFGKAGGGISNHWFACPTLTNCIFENNRAKYYGGGIWNNNYSEIEVTNCLFYKNTVYGSAISGSGGAGLLAHIPITVTNSTFVGNVSASGWYGCGGAIGLAGVFETEDHTLSNCIFWNNYATDLGGEIHVGYVNSASIRACNIEGGIDGPKVCDYDDIIDEGLNINSNPTFVNSIEFSDATVDEGTGTTIKVDDASMYEVDDVIEYNGDGVGRKITDVNTTTDVITFANDAIGSNSLPYRSILNWGQNATDLTFDLQIVSGSPCIDAADGDVDLSKDILGNSRYDDPDTEPNPGAGDPDYVDMGAYEYQGS